MDPHSAWHDVLDYHRGHGWVILLPTLVRVVIRPTRRWSVTWSCRTDVKDHRSGVQSVRRIWCAAVSLWLITFSQRTCEPSDLCISSGTKTQPLSCPCEPSQLWDVTAVPGIQMAKCMKDGDRWNRLERLSVTKWLKKRVINTSE